jgi:hypothetical protein
MHSISAPACASSRRRFLARAAGLAAAGTVPALARRQDRPAYVGNVGSVSVLLTNNSQPSYSRPI